MFCVYVYAVNLITLLFTSVVGKSFIKQKSKMVRLKLTSNMSVLKDVTIKYKNQEEAEVWVAILKTGVCFNSDEPIHDGFYYKSDLVINYVHGDKLQVCLRGNKDVILRFGSQTSRDVFYKAVGGFTEGIEAPCPSPASSGTPSPPKSTPSITSTTSLPSSSE